MSNEIKDCPLCGEEVLAVAKKCKHCGSVIDEEITTVDMQKSEVDYGIFLLAIPIVTSLLIWFWVSGMNLLQSPGDTLALLMLTTIIGTAFVASMEASKVGMKSDRKKGTYSPTAWFFIITFMWIIGYPVYLYKRKHYGLSNKLLAGVIVTLIFVGSYGLMSATVEEAATQMQGEFNNLQRELELLGQ